MAHNVTRLYKNRETYYYRVRIPMDLLLYFGGKQDVKRSLHTKNLTQAKRLLKVWDFRTEQLFTTMRLGMLTREQLARIANAYMHESLESFEESRSLGYGIPKDEDILDFNLELYEEFISNAREALAFNNFKGCEKKVDMLIEEYALDVVKGTPDYIALARAVLIKDIEILRIEKERSVGNYNNGYDDRIKTEPTPSRLSPEVALPSKEQSPMLSDVIEGFLSDLKLNTSDTTTTITDYGNICGLFQRIVGDKEVKSISGDDMRYYLATLRQLPKHIGIKPQYRGKSIKEIIAMGKTDTLNDNTIHKYVTCIKGLFSWAVRQEMIISSPAKVIVIRKNKTRKASEERKVFTSEDLSQLVLGLMQVEKKGEFQGHPERFWIPLVGLYSGMRLNEICQLHIDDVKQDKKTDIWFFNVEATEEDDKSVKSAAGRRPVPIHPILIQIGFLDYYMKMKDDGFPRVWMNLSKTSRGYHRKFANWFLGVKTGERYIYKGFLREYMTKDSLKSFHSFRHTFDNELKQKLIKVSIINELMGHSHGSLALDRYGKGYELQTLQDAMQKLDYDVDLTPLKSVAKLILQGPLQAKNEERLKQSISK